MAPQPTWKNTLNSQHKHHGHIDNFLPLVDLLRYPFYEWNGVVFTSEGHQKITTADVLDLKEQA